MVTYLFDASPICWHRNIYLFRNENLALTLIGLGEDRSLVWVEGDAEALGFGNDSMDAYTIAFGIRNVTHIEKVLSEAYR